MARAERYLIQGEFNGIPDHLRVWNICNVFLNLGQIQESLAERYLEMNLKFEDVPVAENMLRKITRSRHPLFGKRPGDDQREVRFNGGR